MKWTSIRVEQDAARQLEQYRARLERAVAAGVTPHPTETGATRVSLGQALIQLLATQDKRRQAGAARNKLKAERLKNARHGGPTEVDPTSMR